MPVIAAKTDYELTAAEAAVLEGATEDALAAAGERGGAIGGAVGGAIESPHDPEAVRERARATIAETGAVIDDPNAAADGSVWGLVPSGVKDMVPALVRVQTDPTDGGSLVHIRATGREGLIKQKIGAKAADRIAESISRAG